MTANGWTTSGIAYAQTALAHDQLLQVCEQIRTGNEASAYAMIQSVKRQLDTAARMLL